jgi:HK97 gp10 family phage protein
MHMSVRFEGGKELAAALASLPARVSKRFVKEALMEAAEPMRKSAASMAPREPGAPDIADNIVISAARGGKDAFGDAKAQAVNVGPAKGFFYGHYQEWGTVYHAAHPFMRPAFDQNTMKALSILSTSLWRELASKGIGRSSTSNAPMDDSTGTSTSGLGAGTFQPKRGPRTPKP